MKKTLHFLAVASLAFFVIDTKAQLADGSTAPNFTFKDMNGNTQDLYTYLSAGKSVVIDVSAIWCGPCWSYHKSGNLENFYNQQGPSGTNKAMVIYIEGDGSTSDQCMTNASGCTGGPSQGNWVSGTPYPMTNPPSAEITPFNTAYKIKYFPTMYLICPNKKTKLVDQYTTTQLVSALNTNCTTTGINNFVVANSISVLPNPSNGAFTTSFEASNTDNYIVKITNTLGQVVYQETLNNFSGIYSKEMNIASYGKGVYLLVISNGKNEDVKKVITY